MDFKSGSSQAQTSISPASLITEGASLVDRLNEINMRIAKIGDALHGSQPRDANSGAKTPEPLPSVRRNINALRDTVSNIEDSLNHIESGL